MAIKNKFTCTTDDNDYVEVSKNGNTINLTGECWGEPIDIILDIPTAIKMAKTLRTEINRIKGI